MTSLTPRYSSFREHRSRKPRHWTTLPSVTVGNPAQERAATSARLERHTNVSRTWPLPRRIRQTAVSVPDTVPAASPASHAVGPSRRRTVLVLAADLLVVVLVAVYLHAAGTAP